MAVKPPRDPQDVGYTLPTVLAIGVHLVVIAFTLIRLPSTPAEPDSSSIVQATFVSTETFTDQAQQVTEQQAALNSATEPAQSEPAPEAPSPAEQAAEAEAAASAQREAEAAARAEQQARDLAEAQAEAEAEAQRREQEAQRAAEEQAAEQRAREEAEAQRQAEAEAQREAEAEAQRQREAEAEAQRQREAEAEAQRQREAEAEAQRQREAEAEAQRQREAEERRAAEAAEAAMQRQLAGEAEAAANAQQAQQAANSFINIVRRAVEQAWVIPPGASNSMSATIQVRLGPSGELLATSVVTSSGDSAFDRSAMQAVEHAAPFGELRDLPADQQRNLRQFNLRFTPGDVR